MSKEKQQDTKESAPTQDNRAVIDAFVVKQFENKDVLATSNQVPVDEFSNSSLENKLLPPTYDPFKLAILAESSSILNQCVDVMEVNCESFGYELVPSVDEETFRKLKGEQEGTGEAEEEEEEEPAEEGVEAKPPVAVKAPKVPKPVAKATVADKGTKTDKPNTKETEIDAEFRRLTNFFKYVNRSMSYIQLRRRTRRDYELTGNAYWEVLRNQLTGKITGIEWLPSNTVRIGRTDRKFTDYTAKRKISDTEIEAMPDKRKFRCYAQIKEVGSTPVWFKEFGDPRIMDADTGAKASIKRNPETGAVTTIIPVVDDRFPQFDVEKFKAGKMRLATEVIHFCLYNSTRSLPYGVPRWIGNLISIIGSRASEEVNVLYFDNKTVPPGMLLVSGGKISKGAVDRITTHIKDHIKGTKNYHSILVVEAENQVHPNLPAPSIPKLQWVPMKDAQNSDALFQDYDQQNIEKIISSFRFWPGFVGRVKDINRATSDTARKLSEEQVFEPERMEFDSIVNRTLLVDMDINYWEHKSKGPQLSTPQDKADLLFKTKDFVTIKEGRKIAAEVFGKDFEEHDEENWVQLTPAMLLALVADPTYKDMALPESLAGELKKRAEEKKKADAEQAAKEMDLMGARFGVKPGAKPGEQAKPGEGKPPFGAKPNGDQVEDEEQQVAKFLKQLTVVRKMMESDKDFLNKAIGR